VLAVVKVYWIYHSPLAVAVTVAETTGVALPDAGTGARSVIVALTLSV